MNNDDYIKNIRYYPVESDPLKVVLTLSLESEGFHKETYLATAEGQEELEILLSKLHEDGFENLVESFEGSEIYTSLKRKRPSAFHI